MAQQNQPPNNTQTIEITNFNGGLTRTNNGDLNSGLAKFSQSYGYDFFSKPGNLTWLEGQTDITPANSSVMLAGKSRYISETNPVVYMIDSAGKLYKTTVSNFGSGGSVAGLNTSSVVGSVLSGAPTYHYGASMDFFSVPSTIAVSSTVSEEKIFVGSDSQVNSIRFNGSADAIVGIANDYTPNKYHPLKKFTGFLLVGDGQGVSKIDNTNTISTSIFGALPTETRVKDIDISPDGNYALISSATTDYEPIAVIENQFQGSISADGAIYYWNGADLNPTAINTIPGSQVTALQSYLQNNMFFITDSMGLALSDGTNKILSLPNNKAPFPNATGTNGNFLFWTSIENADFAGTPSLFCSLYYFGSIDANTPPALHRLFRVPSNSGGIGGNILQSPFNILASTSYSDLDPTRSSVITVGYGQHYFSILDNLPTGGKGYLYSFPFPPTGNGRPQVGVYETQTQLFPKKITIKQIRVYTEPTVANNEFEFICIGSDGNAITNGSFNYTYAAGTDVTKLQGSLERIDFNPAMQDIYALGVRIINFGSVNMTIHKIEMDYQVSGK